VTNNNQSELCKALSSILKSAFFEILYFYMDNRKLKLRGPSKSRFVLIIFLFRLAGIPFKMKKISTVYTLYMITVILCACTTYVGMILDVYVHRDDLEHAMTTLRALIPSTNTTWLYLYCR
jgi:prolipoprotein diacylglyceryltransferase